MMKLKNNQSFLWNFAFLSLLFLSGAHSSQAQAKTQSKDQSSNSLANQPASLYDIPLIFQNTEGKEVKLSRFQGKPAVMTMTYTFCEYACPRIIEKVKLIQKEYQKKKIDANYVIVSFDPERDTPAHLKGVKDSNPETKKWFYLTGQHSQIRQLSMILGIRYEKNPETQVISHDNKILILDQKGVIQKELQGLKKDISEAMIW